MGNNKCCEAKVKEEIKDMEGTKPEEVEAKELDGFDISFSPAVDILEDGDLVRLNMNLPGVAKEDISINLENGLLKITGRMKKSMLEGYNPILQEYREGSYYRSFRLSDEIDAESIKAGYKDGVLTLELHKGEKAKRKQITIE